MDIKSRLKPEGSAISGLAVVGSVFAIYSMDVGTVSAAHYSDANQPSLENSRKKAGYTSFILVSAIALITKDSSVAILGYGSIVAAELHYRTAIMTNPASGMMEAPNQSVYSPAMYAVPDADNEGASQDASASGY